MSPEKNPKPTRTLKILLPAMLLGIFLGGLGFVYKIVQFTKASLVGMTFTVPVTVYLCMALGFICLLVWAISRGMFHNVERPKLRMLEREEEYERKGL